MTMDYDVLVVGSGIGGMESALKLGDMGYKVLVVEKEASVGGRMILLSKVFPTLDCASCISTPKMAATIHHPNLTVLTYSEVRASRATADGRFRAKVRQKARYVDEVACTGCQQCETACTVAVPDQFNADLVARRAAYIAFPQAVPKKAVIDRQGSSPCTFACPAGIEAHGYVSLIRSGEYEKAYRLVLDATPLVGTLGRACYAPCEARVHPRLARGHAAHPPAQALHRRPARRVRRGPRDRGRAARTGSGSRSSGPVRPASPPPGSSPARATRVKIFEAAPEPGGFLRLAIPSYRLPVEVVERDIDNVRALGVEIVTSTPRPRRGRAQGATASTPSCSRPARRARPGWACPARTASASMGGPEFLRKVKLGAARRTSRGKQVVVVGGGNVAMDAARVARRLGAASVTVAYRRGRAEMPAHHVEADDAEKEGVRFTFQVAPAEVVGRRSGAVSGLRCVRMALGEPDSSGRRRPEPIKGSEFVIPCQVVIGAIGMTPDTAAFASLVGVERNGALQADPKTLQTNVPYVFAAGDVVNGATDITRAVGEGRRAAHMIDRWLTGGMLDGVRPAPARGGQGAGPGPAEDVHAPAGDARERHARGRAPGLPGGRGAPRRGGGPPGGRTLHGLRRLLGLPRVRQRLPGGRLHRSPGAGQELDVEVGAVVVSTGFKLFAADLKPQYGFGQYRNVITGMQMDRLLAPTRPFNTVLRPSDGKVPDRIAYVMCTGSRDETVGNPLCSKFCCMYSVKQNQLIMGALPLAEVTVHYIDIRAAGKRYDEFYEQAKSMGATYVKGRVA